MDDELTRLIESGPDPTRALRHLVMTRFADITAARQLARSWREIAQTLQLAGRHKSLAAAYWRVKRGIEAGRLAVAGKPVRKPTPASMAHPPAPGTKPAEAQHQPAAGRFKHIKLD